MVHHSAARGLDHAIARYALERGDVVVATPRAGKAGLGDVICGRLYDVASDVTHRDQVTAAVDFAYEQASHIDVLVNNAGRGLVGAVEETSEQETRAVFEVNGFATLAVRKR